LARLARFRIAAIPLALLLVSAQTALATHWEPGYQNYGRGGTTSCRVSGDRFTSFAYVRWTATQANNLRATGRDNGDGNLRYTQDMRDAHNHVDADGYWISNFPDPKFDNENDGFFESKREEAEMTAQSATFPVADKLYHFSARYSHWSGKPGTCGPTGDGSSGRIGHNEHMSQKNFFGEWDTFNFAYSTTKYVSYPSVCLSCSSAALEGAATHETVTEEAPTVLEFRGPASCSRPQLARRSA